MARKSRLGLTEDERKRFDDIGLDQINQMSDVKELHRLMRVRWSACRVSPLHPPVSRSHEKRRPWTPRSDPRPPPVLEPRPSLREEGFPQTAQVVKHRTRSVRAARTIPRFARASRRTSARSSRTRRVDRRSETGRPAAPPSQPLSDPATTPPRPSETSRRRPSPRRDRISAQKDSRGARGGAFGLLWEPSRADATSRRGDDGTRRAATPRRTTPPTRISPCRTRRRTCADPPRDGGRHSARASMGGDAEREKGNELFKAREYRSAVDWDPLAIALDQNAAAHASRTAPPRACISRCGRRRWRIAPRRWRSSRGISRRRARVAGARSESGPGRRRRRGRTWKRRRRSSRRTRRWDDSWRKRAGSSRTTNAAEGR